MYSLIVVDDEEDIRRGIIHSIPWESWGFHVVGEASSGLTAIPLLEKNSPDVVLTDIRMPGMDGLELMRYVEENHPQAMVIVLSGHSDFDYMKSAIRHGVAMYLLKPTDLVQFEETFQIVSKKLNQMQSEKKTLEKSIAYLRDYQLTAFIQGALPLGEEVMPLIEKSGLPPQLEGCQIAVFSPDYSPSWFDKGLKDWPFLRRALITLLNQKIRSHYHICQGLFFLYDQKFLCAVIQGTKPDYCLQAVLEEACIQMGIPVLQYGVSGYKNSSLAMKLVQARVALSEEEKTENPKPLTIAQPTPFSFPNASQITLLLADSTLEEEKFIADIAFWAKEIVAQYQPDFYGVDLNLIKLLLLLADGTEKIGLDLPKLLHRQSLSFELLYDIPSLKGKTAFLQYVVQVLFKHLHLANPLDSNEHLAAQTLEIIEGEYTSHQLSLGSVADRLQRSQAHISRVFKEVTGNSFVKTVRTKRMEKALELLRITNMGNQDIALAVGYPDVSNFMRIFKKEYGTTPSAWRRKHVRGEGL